MASRSTPATAAGEQHGSGPSVDEPLLHDVKRLQALASPVRLAILQYLATTGPATATECARVAGVSPTACSYHLRVLAEHGFVVGSEGADRRQRPWRLADAPAMTFTLKAETPEGDQAAAHIALERAMEDRDRMVIDEYYAQRDNELDVWKRTAVVVQDILGLSAEDLEELGRALDAAIQPFRDRRPDPAQGDGPGEGRRWIYVSLKAIPWLAVQPNEPSDHSMTNSQDLPTTKERR